MKKSKLLIFPLLFFVLAVVSGCSKDDQFAIKVKSISTTYDAVNNCNNGLSTAFNFELEAKEAITQNIQSVKFDVKWENGTEINDLVESNVTVTGSMLTFAYCFNFITTNWVEVTVEIVDDNGVVISAPKTVRIQKPPGAN